MSSAPYWGQLPGPKIASQQPGAEFQDGDTSLPDFQTQSQPNHVRDSTRDSLGNNRASAQTEAVTETTLSPLASPTDSSFANHGLAPRPPSYQTPLVVPPDQGPSTRTSRRKSRHQQQPYSDQVHREAEASTAPPVSFRHPYGNGGLPYTHPEGNPRSAGPPTTGEKAMDYAQTYPTNYGGQHESFGDGGAAAQAPVSAGTSSRRKNMTKEEKRARVEAAERRARERAGKVHAEQPLSQPLLPQATSRNWRQSASYEGSRSMAAPAPKQAPVARDPQSARDVPQTQKSTRRHHNDARSNQEGPRVLQKTHTRPAYEPAPDVPRRNLSFRERAARDDVTFEPMEYDMQESQHADTNGGGFSLTRSGSNKLKKEPPGDPWHRLKMESQQQRDAPAATAPAPAQQPQRAPEVQLWPDSRQQRQPPAQAPPPTSMRRPTHAEEDIQPIQRRATEPVRQRQQRQDDSYFPPVTQAKAFKTLGAEDPMTPATPAYAAERRRLEREDSDNSSESSHHHRISGMLYKGRESMAPGDGLYQPPNWLDEWTKASVGRLEGSSLNVSKEQLPTIDKNKAWWEGGGRRASASQPRPEAFDGEYDDLNGPTRFKPSLYLECGPLLRYCGMRTEKVPARTSRGAATAKEFWRGSVMIVTRDSDSSYDIAPTLRMFLQDLELLPAPPHHINGDLSPEYVDPIAGHPKLGRRGETLFVRPVEHLEEARDLSQIENDDGLFEATRSVPDGVAADGINDYPGTFASRMKRVEIDGEKLQKFKDVRGFRLHAERGCTFWRFNIEVELRDKQQRIAYRINRGPCNSFWVPAKGHSMNIMFHSCNGFSIGAKANSLSGPDPMWRDVLNNHQTTPFHVMIGGGDQIYNDEVGDDCDLFTDWLEIRNPFHKHNAPLTAEMQTQLEDFYFENYCMWFSMGLFGLANSQIPMVNIWSDRESFNGYGSYAHRDMYSPVLSGLGAVAFKYYMLFQHQSIIPETEQTEPSWILGAEPGPYVNEQARNVYVSLGSKMALLSADCRTERTEDNVIEDKTWEKIMNRLYTEVRRGQVEHLLVVLPVPIAYPRLVWLENILTSRVMNPVKALSKKGLLGNALNNIDGGTEVMDDLRDHWTAKNHKHERTIVVEDLQDLAIDKSLRITILSGDVNMAAVGQFYSNPKLQLPKHKDPRYMPNVISSAIANAPPPDIMADVLNRRHKVHHFDEQTEESMIPMFQNGVDGKPRNNKRLLPHRNWCSIRQWVPGGTPPPTPPVPSYDGSATPPTGGGGGGGLLRRLSLGSGARPDMSKESVRGSRPPVSSGGGLFRSLSNRLSRRNSASGERPSGGLTRTLSLGGARGGNPPYEGEKRGLFGLGRRNSQRRPDDGGINGTWGEEEDDLDDYPPQSRAARPPPQAQTFGLRGGAPPAHDEYSEGDEDYFTAAPPRRANTLGARPTNREDEIPPQALRPFHRTPTGLSVKQLKKSNHLAVDLEGGLDICLNVEVNPRDPTGITVPYRLLVPKLFYEYTSEADDIPVAEPSGFKRLLSLRKKEKETQPPTRGDEINDEFDQHERQQQQQHYYQGGRN